MKKIIICVLCALRVNLYAQNIAYNDCIKNARYADGEWTAESIKANYLIRTSDKKILNNLVFKNKLTEIRNIFFKAYPTPKAVMGDCWISECNSHGYGNSTPKIINSSPEPFYLGTWFSALKCNKNGILIKKLGEELTNYDFHIYINTIVPENGGLWWLIPHMTDNIDKVKYKKFEEIYCIPPHDNFNIENERTSREVKITNSNFNNSADKYFVFRNKSNLYGNPTNGYVDMYNENVIMTYNNKLPYTPLTIGELFQIVALNIQQYSKQQDAYMHQKNQDASNIKSAEKIIAENDKKLAKIKELITYFQKRINESAIVTDYYKNYSFIIEDLDKPCIKDMFITEVKKGYTYSVINPAFFKSNKMEDVQIIQVKWSSKKKTGGNPDKQTAEDKLPLLDYGLTNAMQVFDWDKLASLLMK